MGEVIRFRPRERARLERPAPAEAGGATILLFTGVRYERHPDGGAGPVKPVHRRGGRRKRA